MSARRGVLAFVLLLTVLGTAVLIAALSVRRPSTSIASGSVLLMNVPARLEEAEAPVRAGALSLGRLGRPRPALADVVEALRRAADDERIAGLVLHIEGLDWGWAKIYEVREAVQAVRRAGKPVYASLAGGSEREYLLASAAGVVSVPPTETLQLDGLSATALFYRGTYEKLGITPNFVNVGRYKSAVESYTRRRLSPEGREALDAVLDEHYRMLLDTLAAARGGSRESMARLVQGGPYGAPAAHALGLIDTVLYGGEVDSLALVAGERKLPSIGLGRYLERLSRPRSGPRLGLVVAAGTIAPGRSRESAFEGPVLGAETLIEALRQARTRRSVRAIVLRIDSPGGSAQASDDIWREVERCRAAKPLIVSMSDLGGSGGYYIATPADSIVAQPATLTGSIGIYGGKLNLAGLAEKVGVGVEILSRGPRARMLSPFQDFSPDEAAVFRRGLEEFYEGFLDRVVSGRGLTRERAREAAQGRVWTGLAARERGLVDALGGLDRAFAMARARAGIPPDQDVVVERFPRVERSLFARLLEGFLVDEEESLQARLPAIVQAWLAASRFPAGSMLALMPYGIEIR